MPRGEEVARFDDGITSPRSSLMQAAVARAVVLRGLAERRPSDAHALERWWTLDPPYAVLVPMREADRTDEAAPAGRVLLYEARAAETSESLRQAAVLVCHLNGRSPRALVAGTGGVQPQAWAGMKDAGFRCGVISLVPSADSLRLALIGAADFEADVLRWLVRANIAGESHMVDHFIAMLCDDTWADSGNTDTAPLGKRRTVRRHFSAAGLAPPKDWRSTFRWLRMAVASQRDAAESEASISERNHLYDASDLRRVFRAWFGCTLSKARTHLGWEWLLWAAIQRRRLLRNWRS